MRYVGRKRRRIEAKKAQLAHDYPSLLEGPDQEITQIVNATKAAIRGRKRDRGIFLALFTLIPVAALYKYSYEPFFLAVFPGVISLVIILMLWTYRDVLEQRTAELELFQEEQYRRGIT